MANDIFNPTITQVGSVVTPTEGVVPQDNLGLFTELANVAVEATKTFTGQSELEDLNKTFSKISQARAQGGKSSTLQAKARAALDQAKANAPWIADKADSLFKTTFGGGSGGGVFEKSPQEKAEEAYAQQVKQTSLQLNISETEAQKRIAFTKNAEHAAEVAKQQKQAREYNGELVFANTATQINKQSLDFQDAIRRGMEQNGGALSQDSKRSLIMMVDQTAAKMLAELNSNVRDDATGHLLVGKKELEDTQSKVDAWVKNTKEMINDQAMLKVIQDANAEQNAEIQLLANEKFKTLKVINAAGGQAAVDTYLKVAQRPEGPAKQLLINSNPVVQSMFAVEGSFSEAGASGVDKVFLPEAGDNPTMNEAEALATGTLLADPANAKITQTVVEQAASNPQAAQAVNSMVAKNPDSAVIAVTDKYKAWRANNAEKGKKFEENVLGGLKRSFLATYVADNEKLPDSFYIGPAKDDDKPKSRTSRKSRAPKPNTVHGEGITKESTAALRNMLSIFSFNKDALEDVRAKSGVADLTPQEAVPYFVLGQLPERAIQAHEDAQTVEQPDSTVDLNERGEEFVKKAIDLGWTADDVTVFINRMGFSENAQTEVLRKKLSKAVDMKRKEMEEDPKKKVSEEEGGKVKR